MAITEPDHLESGVHLEYPCIGLYGAGTAAIESRLLELIREGRPSVWEVSRVETAFSLNQLELIPPYLCETLGIQSIHGGRGFSPVEWVYGPGADVPPDAFVLSHGHFDVDLKPLVAASSLPWLEVDLARPVPPDAWVEVRTRFLLFTAGRYRAQSLEVARCLAGLQDKWAERFRLRWPSFGKPTPCGTLPISECFPEADDVVVLGTANFDAELNPVSDGAPDSCLEVALVHPPQLPSHHYCRIRTRFLFLKAGRGREESLAVVRCIGEVQRKWEAEYGARFFVYGRVRHYLQLPTPANVVLESEVPGVSVTAAKATAGAPSSKVIRAYGKRSRPIKQQEAAQAVLSALEVIAYAWNEFARDPGRARFLAFALDYLSDGLFDAARTCRDGFDNLIHGMGEAAELRTQLTARLEEHRPRLIKAEYEEVKQALEHGSPEIAGSLVPEFAIILAKVRGEAVATRARKVPAKARDDQYYSSRPENTVRNLVIRHFRRTWQRFASSGLQLSLPLVREVGERLGYLSTGRRISGPPTLRRDDPRLLLLAAKLLSRRLHTPASTILRTVLKPMIKDQFSGFLFDSHQE